MQATLKLFSAKVESTVLDARWLAWTLVVLGAVAGMATAVLLARGVATLSAPRELALALAAAIAFGVIVWGTRRHAPAIGALAVRLLQGRQVWLLVLAGLVLRLLWVLAFDAQPSSDGLTYIQLATKLANGQPYEIGGTRAYWPPGYALFLAPLLMVMPAALAIPASQLALFALAAVGVHRLTARCAPPQAASIALALFCLWPNLIAHSATPEKELLVAALLIWAVIGATGARPASAWMAGMLLGAAMLVQPSTLLLIPAMCALLLMRRRGAAALPIALLLLGAALVVAPWTMRNYEVLGGFKLVSTNGGGNFYRANNPLANGGYTPTAEVDLSHLPELDADRTGKQLALRWIAQHPADFLALVLEKQARFMGDDAFGVYTTFRAEKDQRSQARYLVLKLAANAWWLAIWAGIAALVVAGAQLGTASFLVWGWLYLFGLHSVFESGGKYHSPILWIPCVLMGILLADMARRAAISRPGPRP
jgi:hypothetical protein